MTSTFGAHLLGRSPSTRSDTDWHLADALAAGGNPTRLEMLLGAYTRARHSADSKALLTEIVAQVKALSPAAPSPVPSAGQVLWSDLEQLDQGDTGHCCGFGSAQFCNTLGSEAIDSHFTDADGHALYYEMKAIDGEPGAENGSTIATAAKALKRRGLIGGYAWAHSVDEVVAWLSKYGPMVFGTVWREGMFTPDALGQVHVTGGDAGGHCWAGVGVDLDRELVVGQNSWGPSWGVGFGKARGGYFTVSFDDMRVLLDADGEALAALQIAA